MAHTPRMQRVALSLADAVDAKGSYDGHCGVVSHISQMLAVALGWRGRPLAQVRVAGLLHDVGKLTTPDGILLKPGRLSPWEMAVVREHAVHGHQTLMGLGLETEAKWVLHHHENYDGSGYPVGLLENAIPMGARILHVADSFEAMIATRPYSAPKTASEAINELKSYAGVQFCPDVVKAMNVLMMAHGGILPLRGERASLAVVAA